MLTLSTRASLILAVIIWAPVITRRVGGEGDFLARLIAVSEADTEPDAEDSGRIIGFAIGIGEPALLMNGASEVGFRSDGMDPGWLRIRSTMDDVDGAAGNFWLESDSVAEYEM